VALRPIGLFIAFIRTAWSIEQVRYLLVAGSVALAYLGLVALCLSFLLPYMLAIAIAQVITISFAFPLYRKLIFRATEPPLRGFLRFLSVWAGGLVAGFIATPLLVELTAIPPLAAQVLAVTIVSCASFLGHKFFSFQPKKVGG
jgi:putative flippase GtrA